MRGHGIEIDDGIDGSSRDLEDAVIPEAKTACPNHEVQRVTTPSEPYRAQGGKMVFDHQGQPSYIENNLWASLAEHQTPHEASHESADQQSVNGITELSSQPLPQVTYPD